jgi:hypothetical protein
MADVGSQKLSEAQNTLIVPNDLYSKAIKLAAQLHLLFQNHTSSYVKTSHVS